VPELKLCVLEASADNGDIAERGTKCCWLSAKTYQSQSWNITP